MGKPIALAKAAALAFGFVLLFGIPTALIPNPLVRYSRMVPAAWLDYFFLAANSVLLGLFIVLWVENQKKGKTPWVAGSATGAGFLAFACPTCVSLLVLLFGTGFLLSILEPLRPFLGVTSIVLLSAAIRWMPKGNCEACAAAAKK